MHAVDPQHVAGVDGLDPPTHRVNRQVEHIDNRVPSARPAAHRGRRRGALGVTLLVTGALRVTDP